MHSVPSEKTTCSLGSRPRMKQPTVASTTLHLVCSVSRTLATPLPHRSSRSLFHLFSSGRSRSGCLTLAHATHDLRPELGPSAACCNFPWPHSDAEFGARACFDTCLPKTGVSRDARGMLQQSCTSVARGDLQFFSFFSVWRFVFGVCCPSVGATRFLLFPRFVVVSDVCCTSCCCVLYNTTCCAADPTITTAVSLLAFSPADSVISCLVTLGQVERVRRWLHCLHTVGLRKGGRGRLVW